MGRTDLGSIDRRVAKALEESIGVLSRAENQEAARSLRIEQNILHLRRYSIGNADVRAEEIAIVREAAGAKARATVFKGPR